MPADQLNLTVDGLTNGASYQVTIRAHNDAGWGSTGYGPGPLVPATTPGPPAYAAAGPGANLVMLQWSQPATDGGSPVVGYRVERLDPAGQWVELFTADVVARTHMDLNLETRRVYTYRIRAENAVGVGEPTVQVFATPYSVPDAPAALSASSSDAALDVTWHAPLSDGGAPVEGYQLQFAPAGGSTLSTTLLGGTSNYLTSLAAGLTWSTVEVSGTSTSVAGLENGQPYSLRVRARNAAGPGLWQTLLAGTHSDGPGDHTVGAGGADGCDCDGGERTGADVLDGTGQ